MNEMINNKHVLNFYSVEDTVTECRTWFISVESSQPVKWRKAPVLVLQMK